MGFFTRNSEKGFTGAGGTGNCVNGIQHQQPVVLETVRDPEGNILHRMTAEDADMYIKQNPGCTRTGPSQSWGGSTNGNY